MSKNFNPHPLKGSEDIVIIKVTNLQTFKSLSIFLRTIPKPLQGFGVWRISESNR